MMASTLAANSSTVPRASGRKREQEIALLASRHRYDCKRLQISVADDITNREHRRTHLEVQR
ncbi:hypothetical protein LJD47_28445, partial [Escherichia coli]|nr:hypothetical protein [Escherichia coli]